MYCKFVCCAMALAGGFGFAQAALAADIPVKAPVYKAPVAAPIYNWTGFYVGGNAGYVWSADDSYTLTGTDTGAGGFGSELADGTVPSSFSVSPSGFIGGVQAGYNFQSANWVYGIETDIQWTNAKDDFSVTSTNPLRSIITTSGSRELKWLGTFRGRAGMTVAPMAMLYVTGGLAYGQNDLTVASVCPTCTPARNVSATSSKTSAGWTIGGGWEWALDSRWSVKGEYLYYDLGNNDATIAYNYGANTSTMTAHDDNRGHIVRAGFNFKY
jgi:outer membrane immunogenic protein